MDGAYSPLSPELVNVEFTPKLPTDISQMNVNDIKPASRLSESPALESKLQTYGVSILPVAKFTKMLQPKKPATAAQNPISRGVSPKVD